MRLNCQTCEPTNVRRFAHTVRLYIQVLQLQRLWSHVFIHPKYLNQAWILKLLMSCLLPTKGKGNLCPIFFLSYVCLVMVYWVTKEFWVFISLNLVILTSSRATKIDMKQFCNGYHMHAIYFYHHSALPYVMTLTFSTKYVVHETSFFAYFNFYPLNCN